MQSYLFLLTIGPVQSFIAQARKTQDLYAGSQLLADLTWSVLHCFQYHTAKPRVIYPQLGVTKQVLANTSISFELDKNEASFPNRVLAIVDFETADGITEFGQKIEKNIRRKFQESIKQYLTTALEGTLKNAQELDQLMLQCQDFLEIYWAAVSMKNKAYNTALIELEQQLSGLKAFRRLQAMPDQVAGKKCYMDGQHNIKVYRLSLDKPNKHLPKAQEAVCIGAKETDKVTSKMLQAGEGLSTLSFFKRLYRSEDSFPSTAEIALLHCYQHEVIRKELEDFKAYFKQCFEQSFEEKTFDPQLYFEENLSADALAREGWSASESVVQDLKAKQQALTKFIKAKGYSFSNYYVLLRFDGDGIGNVLRALTTQEEHTAFSKYMVEFAQKARAYIDDGEEHDNSNKKVPKGRTIYAGGDDFLGLINLQALFEVIEKLQHLYKKHLATPLQNLLTAAGKSSTDLSLSAGIVIAHYKTPLREVVQYSKNLEKRAKQQSWKNEAGDSISKNHTAIGFMSGHAVLAEGHFHNRHWAKLKVLCELMAAEKLSKTYIFTLARTLARLPQRFEPAEKDIIKAAIITEQNRLLERALNPSERVSTDLAANKAFLEALLDDNINENELNSDNYCNVLDIAGKLASKLQYFENTPQETPEHA